MTLQESVVEYSEGVGHVAQHFASCACHDCGTRVFEVLFDEVEGVAGRICATCDEMHWIGDSETFLEEVESFHGAKCPCGHEHFEVMVGVSLYQDSEDVRWLYLGCQCTKCGDAGVYADWKCEYPGFRELLARV